MKIFYKVIIVERGRDIPLQLVSVGMVREDGTEQLYVVNEECLSNVSRHPWLSINVWPLLPARSDQMVQGGGIIEWDKDHPEHASVMALDRLIEHTRDFVTSTPDAELWGWYGAYDFVVLTQLYGNNFAEQPAGIPLFHRELAQLWEGLGRPELPAEPADRHALRDAHWARDAHLCMTDPAALTREHEQAIGFLGHPDAGVTTLTQDVQVLAPASHSPRDSQFRYAGTVPDEPLFVDVDWIEARE